MKKHLIVIGMTLVLLTVSFSGCIENKPPTFTLSVYPKTGYQPLEVSFEVNASDPDGSIESFYIDFGDGTGSTSLNTIYTHTYSAGTYKVTVNVTDDQGAKTSKNITIIVENKAPSASISASTISGKAPLSVSFSGSGTDSDGTIVTYSWNFGDGGNSNEQNPSHIFQTPGIYHVVLTAEDNDGSTATDSLIITIEDNQPPTASASADEDEAYKSLTVHFTGSGTDSDGEIVSYHWDFGDGETSNEKNPTHTYHHVCEYYICYYTVKLTVTDDSGSEDSDIEIITLTGLKMTVTSSWFSYLSNRMYYDIKVETCFDVDTEGCYRLTTSKVGEEYETCSITTDGPDTIPAGGSASWSVIFHTTSELAGNKLIWKRSFGDIVAYVH